MEQVIKAISFVNVIIICTLYKECLNIWAYEFEYWLVNILKFAVLIIAAKVNLLKSEPKFA